MIHKLSIVLVVGTRPEAIKLAPVYLALKASSHFQPLILSTGQHREMLHQALAAFDITPDHDLELMTPGQSLPELTARTIVAVSGFLKTAAPTAVLVQGDTTSVLAASLAASYERIPVGHVEAGLRTYDMNSPWPEEINRRLTAPLCRWCFAPTEESKANLLSERIDPNCIHVTGNTVIDSLYWVRERMNKTSKSVADLAARLNLPETFRSRFLERPDSRWLLVTGHRRESFGQGFEEICEALLQIANAHPDVGILYPVHLNPNVREPVNRLLAGNERIALVEPASYEDFIWLMDHCYFVMSDSGGVQEEAPSLGKPVLVLRETTERPEGVVAGTCKLVGTNPVVILREVARLLGDSAEYQRRSTLANPYGDGTAAARIVGVLERDLIGSK